MYSAFIVGVAIFLLGIAGIDLKKGKIPNWSVLIILIAALAYHTAFNGWNGTWFAVKGLLTGMAILLPFYLLGGTAAGDVKLMGAVGAVLGASGIVNAFVYIALIGGVYSLLLLIVYKERGSIFKNMWASVVNLALTKKASPSGKSSLSKGAPGVRYGVAIALGTIAYMALDWYGYPLFRLIQ